MTQDLTALNSSGCAVSVWKHLYITLVEFHNTHAKSNVVLKKTLFNCNTQMRFCVITSPKPTTQ